MSEPERKTQTFAVELDEGELAVRIVEATGDITRPAGMTPAEIIAGMETANLKPLLRIVRAAVLYFYEQMNKGAATRIVHVRKSDDDQTCH